MDPKAALQVGLLVWQTEVGQSSHWYIQPLAGGDITMAFIHPGNAMIEMRSVPSSSLVCSPAHDTVRPKQNAGLKRQILFARSRDILLHVKFCSELVTWLNY
jgi:hypothetical protein